MEPVLKILFVEDSEDDAMLIMHEITSFGLKFVGERVYTAADFQKAIQQQDWDIILCDFSMPSFSGLDALQLLREKDKDIPFIFISGTLPEEVAVASMCAGATDYILKQNLKRLPPAIVRSIADAATKRDKKKYEQQLFQAQKMDSLGQLVGGVAHDFNNMLMIMQGYLEPVRMLCTEQQVPSQYIHKIDQTMAVIQSGKELIKSLLMFSRAQSSELLVLSLHEIIPHTVQLVSPLLGSLIEIVQDISPLLWSIQVDKNHFESALINLIINARDAMKNKGIIALEASNIIVTQVPVEIKAKFNASAGEYVRVSVRDSGCGIPPDHMDRIFEPFFTTKEMGKGTGLGLSMVYGLAKQSNGYIMVSSQQKQGTTISLYFPKAPDEKSLSVLAPLLVNTFERNKIILLAEDEADLRQIIRGYLEELGYRVLIAENGKEALKLIKKERKIKLILTDILMDGGLTGPELVERAIHYNQRLKYIFMSGFSRSILFNEGYIKEENAPILVKPFSRLDLAALLQTILA